MLRLAAAKAVAVVSLLCLANVGPVGAASVAISGAGSSFAGNEIQDWVAQTLAAPYSLNVNWLTSSDGDGRLKFAAGAVTFAVSDLPYQTGETLPSFPFIYVPVTAGAVAFMYNLPQLDSTVLQLSSYSACAIFTGQITMWNDPAIAVDNPGVALPHLPIVPVTRSDADGTNLVLGDYCMTEQPSLWANFHGGQAPSSTWPDLPNGQSALSAEAAADEVTTTPGEITAIEPSYALERHTPVASVKNASGDYTSPSNVGVESALAYATTESNGTEALDFNGTGPNVYNPSMVSYLLTPTSGLNPSVGAAIASFADYGLTVGQEPANIPGYAPIGASLAGSGVAAIDADVPGANTVTLNTAEQAALSCGGLTTAEVQAGATSATCGQTITFTSNPPNPASVGGNYTPSATASSGLPVALSIDPSANSVCSINSGSVSFNAAGTCVIDANQGGDGSYSAAPQVQQSVTVTTASQTTTSTSNPVMAAQPQTIYFTSAAPGGPGVGSSYRPTATATSGLPVAVTVDASAGAVCSILAGVVTFDRTGTCVLDANQSGGAGYAPAAEVEQKVTVPGRPGTPAFTTPSSATGSAGKHFSSSITVTGSSATELRVVGHLPPGIRFKETRGKAGPSVTKASTKGKALKQNRSYGRFDASTKAPTGAAGLLTGVPAADAGGVFHFEIVAKDASGTTIQPFTTTISAAPAIISPWSDKVRVGTSTQVRVTTPAYPAATDQVLGTLPAGFSWVVNSSGGITITANPGTGSVGMYDLTLTASNSLGTTAKAFVIVVQG